MPRNLQGRRVAATVVCQLTLFSSLVSLTAEEPDIFGALDANRDGFIATDEVPAEKKDLFARLLQDRDSNKDGKLARDEFGKPDSGAPPVGPPGGGDRPRPVEVIKQFDSDGDGKLTREEAPEKMLENFDRIDANSDGSVDLTELQQAFERLGRGGGPGAGPGGAADADRIFEERDANKDGQLTPDEVPAEHREKFREMLSRLGAEGANRQQFARALAILKGSREGATPPGTGNPASAGAPGLMPRGPLFAALDTNSDGEFSAEEIKNASQSLLKLDRDGDGKLSSQELVPFPGGPGGLSGPGTPGGGNLPAGFNPLDFMERQLTNLDKNGDRKIQKEEASGPLAAMFDRADANSDGELDEKEIRQTMERMRERFRRPSEK